jgi:hypothetical protein
MAQSQLGSHSLQAARPHDTNALPFVCFTSTRPNKLASCCHNTPAAGMLPASASAAAAGGAYDFEAQQYDATVPLSKYKGHVLVVVNIASE